MKTQNRSPQSIIERYAYRRAWGKRNRQHLNQWHREKGWEAKVELVERLGGKCKYCGFSDVRALQFDHINGGGAREVKKSGSILYRYKRWLRLLEEGNCPVQLLCANCNWIKRWERGEHKKALLVVK